MPWKILIVMFEDAMVNCFLSIRTKKDTFISFVSRKVYLMITILVRINFVLEKFVISFTVGVALIVCSQKSPEAFFIRLLWRVFISRWGLGWIWNVDKLKKKIEINKIEVIDRSLYSLPCSCIHFLRHRLC